MFESAGDEVDFYRHELLCSQEAMARLRTRANDQTGPEPFAAYTDRTGKVHWPFSPALELARKFCATEPATVLKGIEATERQWSLECSRPGSEYLVSLLNEYRASWAIIRQWTGLDPAIAEREAQIQRLERLVWDAVYALQKAGLDSEAGRLRRALEKG